MIPGTTLQIQLASGTNEQNISNRGDRRQFSLSAQHVPRGKLILKVNVNNLLGTLSWGWLITLHKLEA